MSLFKELVDNISHKVDNNIELNYTEKSIKNKFSEYITSRIFTTNKITEINIDELNSTIETIIINNQQHIIKLLFSNNKYIFVNKSILTKIQYFKNMLEGYEFNNNSIVEIKVITNIDSYKYMNEVINFVYDGVIYDDPIKFKTLYKKLIMIDFIGPIKHNNKHIISYFLDYHITSYDNLTILTIEYIYTLLIQNSITNIDKFIINLWIASIKLNITDTTIVNYDFFNNIIIKNIGGIQFILDNKYIQYYPKIISINNYRIVIKNLLENNNIYSWEIIIDIIKSPINFTQSIHDYLNENFDVIKNTVFNVNITKLQLDLQVKLLIKFKNYNFIDIIGTQIIEQQNVTLWDKLVTFITNNNHVEGNKLKQFKLGELSPPTHYKTTYGKKIQLLTIYPLKYKSWKKVGNVCGLYGDNGIIVNILLVDNQCIDNNTELMINNNTNEPYNICHVEKILYCNYDEIVYKEINNITNNVIHKHCTYAFILNKDTLSKINIKDNIYL